MEKKFNLFENEKKTEKFTLSALVANKSGILLRLAMVLSKRNYSIHFFNVKPTANRKVKQMIMIIEGESQIFPQVIKQMSKLVDIIQIRVIASIVERSHLKTHLSEEVHQKVQWKH